MSARVLCFACLLSILAVGSSTTPAEPATQPASPPALAVAASHQAPDGVTVATLSNGLTVILRENHDLPVFHVQTAVATGGLYEGRWLGCGLSHLLEHLVAKGATRGAGHEEGSRESRSRLDAIGAQSNAYTSLDRTVYFINCVAGRADEAVDILADWIVRPDITEQDFVREHGVVQRELEMGKDDPPRQHYYAHMANFYGTHPAATPVIGYLDALRNVTYEDVLAYHARRYVPRNAVVVAVGDFDSAAMIEHICRAFAGFAAARSPAEVLPEVPALTGVRRVVVANPAVKETSEFISFRSIPLIHPDLYALDVLSYVLTNGESARLPRIVVREKQLATGVASWSWTPDWGAGQFTVSFQASPELADAAEAEIFAQLARLCDEGITEAELAKAKRQKVADFVYGQQSVQDQGSTLAVDFLSTRDVGFSRSYTDRIQAVTAEQVRAVARQYLTPDAVAVTRMVGQASATQPVEAAAARQDRTERFTLPNGLTVVLGPTDTVELVSMTVAVKGGVLVETEQTNGLGQLMAELSLKGAGERSAEQIDEFFDAAGGGIGAQCGNNSFLWQATVLADDAPAALEILADVVIRPTFPQRELDIFRPMLLAAIERSDEQWTGRLQNLFREKFYGAGQSQSPYRFKPIGSADVVAGADREAIAAHHERYVKAGSAVLSIYGHFDPVAMRSAAEKLFAAMPAGSADLPAPARRTVEPGGERYVLDVPGQQQAAIMIGWPGMKLSPADAADNDAMNVLDTIISGWDLPRGWLHEELRGKQLVYVVHAYDWVGLAPGAFVVYAATQPDKAAEVVRIIRENIARTQEHRWSEEEIDEAVNIILTSELLEHQTMADLARQSALDELYGFGYDYHKGLEQRLRKVTPADLTAVARKYLAGPAVEVITTPQPALMGQE